MQLQTILFGTYQPPPSTNVRTHRIGFANCLERYVPPKQRISAAVSPEKRKDMLSDSQKRVYQLLKNKTEYVSATFIVQKTQWTYNHCSIMMATLFKFGLLDRYKVRSGKTSHYVYKMKEQNDGCN